MFYRHTYSALRRPEERARYKTLIPALLLGSFIFYLIVSRGSSDNSDDSSQASETDSQSVSAGSSEQETIWDLVHQQQTPSNSRPNLVFVNTPGVDGIRVSNALDNVARRYNIKLAQVKQQSSVQQGANVKCKTSHMYFHRGWYNQPWHEKWYVSMQTCDQETNVHASIGNVRYVALLRDPIEQVVQYLSLKKNKVSSSDQDALWN